jgi:ABC-2 type transport system permease protein
VTAADRQADLAATAARGRDGAPAPATGILGAVGARAGFRQAVLFEWTKLRSARSLWGTLAVCGVLPPVFAAIVAATGSLQPDDTILGASLTGAAGAQLAAICLGALVLTTEHTTRTLLSTFAVSPRRGTVLTAKATVVGTLTFAVTLASGTGAFLVGRATLDGDRYATGDPFPALLGVALCVALTSLLGLAVGTLLRHSAGAIAAGAGVLLLPSFLGPFLGDLRRWVGGASPLAALEKLTQTSDATHEAVGRLGGWASLLVVAGLALGALALSARRLRARDL